MKRTFFHKPTRLLDMLVDGHILQRCSERHGIKADRTCNVSQNLILNDPSSVDVVRPLDGGHHCQALPAVKLIRREDGRDRRP